MDLVQEGDLVVGRRGEDGEAGRARLPGLNFTADRAVLHYTIRTLLSRRWAVDVVRWRPTRPDVHRWAREQATQLIQQSRPRLVVGKSLGTWGLPTAIPPAARASG